MNPDESVCAGLLPLTTILVLASTSIKGNNATWTLAKEETALYSDLDQYSDGFQDFIQDQVIFINCYYYYYCYYGHQGTYSTVPTVSEEKTCGLCSYFKEGAGTRTAQNKKE